MKNLAQTRIVFSPVRHRIFRWRNWWPIGIILSSTAITVFIIFCATKAVK